MNEPLPLLDVAGLSVRFGDAVVLDGVDLRVRPGRALVVLGRSGSGKSTLLRACLGLLPSQATVRAERFAAGDLDLRAAGPEQWRQFRREAVGMVHQDAVEALSPLRTVGSLLTEAIGQPDGADVAEDVSGRLAAVGLPNPAEVAARYCFELSGGMAQRVGLALATARRPGLLLADEPTTALDGPSRAGIVRRLRGICRDGAGLVLVTHAVDVAAALADDVLVLERGAVVAAGPAAEVLLSPTEPSTARLLAQVPWALPVRTGTPDGVAEPAPPALRLRGLSKGYRAGERVLHGLDLDIAAGEVLGVCGPSGAGKSTLIGCTVGTVAADSGEVAIAGQQVRRAGWRRVRRFAQYVPQDPRAALNPWHTAAKLVAAPLAYHRIGSRTQRAERAAELLERVGLAGLGHRRPGELSTGQCQRVAIARALAVRPTLLVADEPTSALDPQVQSEVLALLRGLIAEDGTAAMVVSHDLHVLERLCDRIAVLADGGIVDDAPTPELRTAARHRVSRELLACYPPDPLERLRGDATSVS